MMSPWVWAPRAQKVDLVTDGATRPMTRQEGDVFISAPIPEEMTYAFSLDGGPSLPDPRAPRLPHGVHGPAAHFDPGKFAWQDQGFRAAPLSAGLIYEAHVGTFSKEGTFDGMIPYLDRLVDLGVTHVELMPLASFPGRHGWGYDGVGLFAVHEPYGGPEGLCRLVDACHGRGLAVLLDVVYNHLGPEGNYLARFGPYFTDRVQTPWGQAVNLDDRGSDPVRRFFLDNARWWMEGFHIDGLRLDAIHALEDRSATHLLEELRLEVDELQARLGKPLVLIAESDLNDPRVVTAPEMGGLGMHAQWADDLHHAVHALLTGERTGYYEDFGSFAEIAKGLRSPYILDGGYARFRQRRHGRPNTRSGHHFVVYSQTHDQVGNRAAGERLHHLCGLDRARLALTLMLLSPGIPMLFMGEEWAASTPFCFFCDFEDPELQKAVKHGRRREFEAFGWSNRDVRDPTDPATFESSILDWTEVDREPHASFRDYAKALVGLRRSFSDLTNGRFDLVQTDSSQTWLKLARGRIRAAVTLEACELRVQPGRLLLTSHPEVKLDGTRLGLPAASTAVWAVG